MIYAFVGVILFFAYLKVSHSIARKRIIMDHYKREEKRIEFEKRFFEKHPHLLPENIK